MDKEKDFATWFAESVEQATPEQAISENYSGLGNTSIFIELWNEYNLLHNGDWIQCGNYPEDGVSVPKKADREEAWKLLQRLYERLQPFEDSIVKVVEARNFPYEDWMQSAYNICKEYHLQKSVMAILQPSPEQDTQSSPETAQERPTPTLEQLLPKEIKEADNGITIFQWAVDDSLFTLTSEGLRWSKSHALYGCFVELVSAKLGIRPSNKRIPWKKFDFVANHEAIIKNARDAVNYARNKSGEDPVGSDAIKNYLDSL